MENSNKREIIERDTKKSDKDGFFKQKFEKLDKFVFDVNILNKIIAVFATLFAICFLVFSSYYQTRINRQNDAYEKMLAQIEAEQLNDIYLHTKPDSGTGSASKVNETPMFKSAIEAVCFAFDRFYNYTTFEIKSTGRSTTNAAGQNVELLFSGHTAKYNDGVVFNQNVRKETQTNFGQTAAVETVYTGTEKYKRDGTNIRKSGDRYIADFNGSFYKVNSQVTSYAYYIVNSSTAVYSKSFSFVRNPDGSIAYYKATVLLDSQKATTNYAKEIEEQGGTSYPNITYFEIACIIDRNGDMLSYNSQETMTTSKTIVVNITATINNDFTYVFLSHNQTPELARPNYK